MFGWGPNGFRVSIYGTVAAAATYTTTTTTTTLFQKNDTLLICSVSFIFSHFLCMPSKAKHGNTVVSCSLSTEKSQIWNLRARTSLTTTRHLFYSLLSDLCGFLNNFCAVMNSCVYVSICVCVHVSISINRVSIFFPAFNLLLPFFLLHHPWLISFHFESFPLVTFSLFSNQRPFNGSTQCYGFTAN